MENSLRENYDQRYYSYYKHQDIQVQESAIVRKREVALLLPAHEKGNPDLIKYNQRVIRIEGSQGLNWWFFERYAIDKNKIKVNFYMSLPLYKNGIDKILWVEASERKKLKSEWVKKSPSEIQEYPFLIDIDAEEHNDIYLAHDDAKKCIVKMIEKGWQNITVTFSGMGFHLYIPMKMVTENRNFIPHTKDNIYEEFKHLAIQFYNDCSNRVDTSIYDHMRLIKVPYSVAHYRGCAYIAHTFATIEEFLDFDLAYFEINAYHSYPFNVFHKLKKIGLGVPVTIQWQDENQRAQLLKKLKTE
jgi:hypothetical protein